MYSPFILVMYFCIGPPLRDKVKYLFIVISGIVLGYSKALAECPPHSFHHAFHIFLVHQPYLSQYSCISPHFHYNFAHWPHLSQCPPCMRVLPFICSSFIIFHNVFLVHRPSLFILPSFYASALFYSLRDNENVYAKCPFNLLPINISRPTHLTVSAYMSFS